MGADQRDVAAWAAGAALVSLVLTYYGYFLAQARDWYPPFLALAVASVAMGAIVMFAPFALGRRGARWILAAAAAMAVALQAAYAAVAGPLFGTDEEVIDYVAALEFLHGRSPYTYNASLVYSLLAKYLPAYFITPTLAGRLVTQYNYMPLEWLLMLPSAALHVRPAYVLAPLALAALVPVAWAYWDSDLLPLALGAFTVANLWFGMAVGSTFDFAWISLAFASLATLRRRWPLSAVFYGLAASFKQTPLVLLPILLGIAYHELGGRRAAAYLGVAGLVVLAASAPFLSPSMVRAVLSLGLEPAIPLGVSSSFLANAYLGLPYRLDLAAFAATWALVAAAAFFLYPRAGAPGAVALSMLFFLAYPRGLYNYFYYVPYLLLAAATIWPPRARLRPPGRALAAALVAAALAAATVLAPIMAAAGAARGAGELRILNATALDPYEYPNAVTEIVAEIYYQPPPGGPYELQVTYARVFTDANGYAGNGLLWYAANGTLRPGVNYVAFYPLVPQFSAPAGQPLYLSVMTEDYSATYYIPSTPRFAYPGYPFEMFVSPYGNASYLINYQVLHVGSASLSIAAAPLGGSWAVLSFVSQPAGSYGGAIYETQANASLLRRYELEYYLQPDNLSVSVYVPGYGTSYMGASLALECGGAWLHLVPLNGTSQPWLMSSGGGSAYVAVPPSGGLDLYNLLRSLGLAPSGECELYVYVLGRGSFAALAWAAWAPAGRPSP